MQKWILLAFIQLLAWQVQGQHKKKINFYELDVIRGLFYQPNTIKPYSGTAFEEYADGKKRSQIPIKDGKPHGKTREWAQNGKKIKEVNYTNGVLHGKETQWYAIGKKKIELEYVNGNVEGAVIEWYKTGRKKSDGVFRNGKEEGEHRWWHDNSQLDQIIFYKNGLAEGVVKNWFRSGKIHIESNFKNGQKNGSTTEWFENGKKFSEEHFTAGEKDGQSFIWNKKGMLIKEEKHEAGKLIESKNYLSGNIYAGDGYWQVFNEMEDFFRIKVIGNSVKGRFADEITFVVDGDLLQLFNQSSQQYFGDDFSKIPEEELLKKYVEKEKQYISNATKFEITLKSEIKKIPSGKKYVYWHFASPSSKDAEQKPRTVQEEHYVSFICGNRILSLYGVVTNNDKPEEIKNMLQRIANSLVIEDQRIDLNAFAKSLKKN